MKKILIIIFILMLLLPQTALAFEEETLSSYDLSLWEKYYSSLDENTFFNGKNIREMIENIFTGEVDEEYGQIFEKIKTVFILNIKKGIGLFAIMASGVVLSALCQILGTSSMGEAAGFVCFGICAVGASYQLSKIFMLSLQTITSLADFIEILSPIISSALVACGNNILGAAISPILLFFNGSVVEMFRKVILPLSAAGGAIAIVGTLTERIKLENMFKFIKSASKWIIGAVFTVYFAVVSINGLSLGNVDSLALKTAKYAADKTLPIIGGAVSGTMESVLASASALKNAIGTAAVITVFALICAPLLSILSSALVFKLTAALCEPIDAGKAGKLMLGMAEICEYAFASVAAVALMFILTVGIAMVGGGV